jgi:hypothetical protein
MPDDPIVAEVRKHRMELFEEAGGDLAVLVKRLKERERLSGHPVVTRARRPTK